MQTIEMTYERVKKFKQEVKELMVQIEAMYKEKVEKGEMTTSSWYKENIKPLRERKDSLDRSIKQFEEYNVQVGDGMTCHLYSDSHAFTIIKRTPKTLTLRRCNAILNPNFKPNVELGGFVGHCTNQYEQSYTYEENEDGQIVVARWSKKLGRWTNKNYKGITKGRSEFYDYNF